MLGSHHSVFIGKWHIGGHGVKTLQPAAHGFDEVPWNRDGGASLYAGRKVGKKRELSAEESKGYLTDTLSDDAVRFLDTYGAEQRKGVSQKPFFLYLCHFAVHTPLQAPEATIQHFANKA